MKYTVTWHDYEDDRSGNPIEIKASSPAEAFRLAANELDRMIGKPNMHFISLLQDEMGKYYRPEDDLPEDIE